MVHFAPHDDAPGEQREQTLRIFFDLVPGDPDPSNSPQQVLLDPLTELPGVVPRSASFAFLQASSLAAASAARVSRFFISMAP
jgi:hypothetical protein